MADSPTPRPTPEATSADRAASLERRLIDALRAWERGGAHGRLAVACSGGADSVALLRIAAGHWPGRVIAFHVNHGLQSAASGFEDVVRTLCAQLGVDCRVTRVLAHPEPGQSPEDAARGARYRALAELATAEPVSAVLLAHHADDQAETLLLALTRGAGVAGLAAMPERLERHGVLFGRPWLGLHGAWLREWLLAVGQAWVDDPTNTDPRWTRNRLRHQVLPALNAAFPGFADRAARSARHAAEAQALLVDLAQQDLNVTGRPPRLVALQGLSRARQANALRCWLAEQAGRAPSTAQLDALLDQIDACRTRAHRIDLRVCQGRVRREGHLLAYHAPI